MARSEDTCDDVEKDEQQPARKPSKLGGAVSKLFRAGGKLIGFGIAFVLGGLFLTAFQSLQDAL